MQHNLEESLAKYLESDVIQRMCPRCGFEYANLTKNIQLSSVLIIQFLRFTFCPQESKTLKIGDKIDTPYIYSPDSTTRYHLSAFICHQGEEATSGHYICGVVSDNSVTIYDDDKEPRVMSLDEAQSLVSSSYIVVYTRKPISHLDLNIESSEILQPTTSPDLFNVPKPRKICSNLLSSDVTIKKRRKKDNNNPSHSLTNHLENIEDVSKNIARLKLCREKSQISPDNPIIEGGCDIHKKLNEITWGTCQVCNECWFDLEIGPRSKKCKRCSKEKRIPGIPLTFSAENDMDPGEQAECLRVLNSVEEAAISLICPVMNIVKLKYGALSLKGHCISFEQDVGEFISRVPRLPADLPYIALIAPGQPVTLTANRHNILAAIKYLIQNNYYYRNVVIDEEALESYPDNSVDYIAGVRTIEDPNLSLDEGEFQTVFTENAINENGLTYTVVSSEVETENIRKLISSAINQTPTQVAWPNRKSDPVSEFKPGYFSMAHPALFGLGKADITVPRIGRNPSLLFWV